jgi:predicted RNase H-like nuclease (RuvC/YqgF family)
LTELKAEFNNGEPERRGDERNFQRYTERVEKLKADIARSEANVESLRRELGAVRN